MNYEVINPSVWAAFHNNTCVAGATVLTGSCTKVSASSFYWSSTTVSGIPSEAWGVGFTVGGTGSGGKGFSGGHVRAVRGGL